MPPTIAHKPCTNFHINEILPLGVIIFDVTISPYLVNISLLQLLPPPQPLFSRDVGLLGEDKSGCCETKRTPAKCSFRLWLGGFGRITWFCDKELRERELASWLLSTSRGSRRRNLSGTIAGDETWNRNLHFIAAFPACFLCRNCIFSWETSVPGIDISLTTTVRRYQPRADPRESSCIMREDIRTRVDFRGEILRRNRAGGGFCGAGEFASQWIFAVN